MGTLTRRGDGEGEKEKEAKTTAQRLTPVSRSLSRARTAEGVHEAEFYS